MSLRKSFPERPGGSAARRITHRQKDSSPSFLPMCDFTGPRSYTWRATRAADVCRHAMHSRRHRPAQACRSVRVSCQLLVHTSSASSLEELSANVWDPGSPVKLGERLELQTCAVMQCTAYGTALRKLVDRRVSAAASLTHSSTGSCLHQQLPVDVWDADKLSRAQNPRSTTSTDLERPCRTLRDHRWT